MKSTKIAYASFLHSAMVPGAISSSDVTDSGPGSMRSIELTDRGLEITSPNGTLAIVPLSNVKVMRVATEPAKARESA